MDYKDLWLDAPVAKRAKRSDLSPEQLETLEKANPGSPVLASEGLLLGRVTRLDLQAGTVMVYWETGENRTERPEDLSPA